MRHVRSLVIALAAMGPLGCESEEGATKDASPDATATDPRDTTAPTPDGTVAETGDRTDAPGGDDARDTQTTPETAEVASDGTPLITSVTARVAGRRGLDLDLAIMGKDSDKDAALARVRVFDSAESPVMAFVSGLDGVRDTHETLVPFATPVAGQASFLGSVRLRDILADSPDIAFVEVAIRDAAGAFSADVRTNVLAQPIRQIGDACDPDAIEDRCADGLGCRGTPGQCQDGIAPEVTRVAYLKGEGGTRILVQGNEPEDDLMSVAIEFLDAAGHALLVDLDNDETPESSDFEVNAAGQAVDGAFVVRIDPVAGFEATVPQIAVTPTDAAGHDGARKTARLQSTPVRSVGQGCDAWGFDMCASSAACVPGIPDASNVCKAKSQLIPAECAVAPVLDPAAGVTEVSGVVDGPSLFDAPPTCSAGDPKGRPEALAVLHLTNPAKKLTLTTALPGTNFDTVLYMYPGCGDDVVAGGAAALGCADDAISGGAAASLELVTVPAGDYLVVVDAWGPQGGTFTLGISIE